MKECFSNSSEISLKCFQVMKLMTIFAVEILIVSVMKSLWTKIALSGIWMGDNSFKEDPSWVAKIDDFSIFPPIMSFSNYFMVRMNALLFTWYIVIRKKSSIFLLLIFATSPFKARGDHHNLQNMRYHSIYSS